MKCESSFEMKQESIKKNGGTERARVASRRLVYILEKAGIETSFFLYLFFIILDINLPPLVIIGKLLICSCFYEVWKEITCGVHFRLLGFPSHYPSRDSRADAEVCL